MKKLFVLTSILLASGFAVFATEVTPAGTFGTLSDFTVGSGNPNDAFMTTTILNNGNTITLGLQAQQRYSNPVLGNNGAGIYYATPGANNGLDGASPAHSTGATWNFDFYFDTTGGSYTYKLYLGTDASVWTSTYGYVDPASSLWGNSPSTHNGGQNSENIVTLGGNPNLEGIYSFELVAYAANGSAIGHSAINVVVGTVPDVASTAMLLGLGFIGLAAFGFRKNRLQA